MKTIMSTWPTTHCIKAENYMKQNKPNKRQMIKIKDKENWTSWLKYNTIKNCPNLHYRIQRKNRYNSQGSIRKIGRDPHDPTYAVIDKHVSTPTSSFFGTLILQVTLLLEICKFMILKTFCGTCISSNTIRLFSFRMKGIQNIFKHDHHVLVHR